MRLPAGFERATRSPVLVHRGLAIGISIMDMELEAGDREGVAGVLAEELEGLQSKTRTEVTRGDAKGVVITGRSGETLRSGLTLRAGTIVASMLLSYPPSSAAAVDAILQSAWLDTKANMDPALMSGLAFARAEGLVVWPATSAPIVFKEPNAMPTFPPDATTFVAVVSPVPSQEELDDGVRGLLDQMHVLRDSITQSSARVDGMEAMELFGDATRDGAAVKFYAMLLKAGEDAIFEVATYSVHRPEVLERLRTLARSTRRVDVLGPIHEP